MKVDYSKPFLKAVDKLSGKMQLSVLDMIREVKRATSINEITDCTRLTGYKSVYRIRIGDYRAFFTFHVKVIDDTVMFEYLVSRGEAYDKKWRALCVIKINKKSIAEVCLALKAFFCYT